MRTQIKEFLNEKFNIESKIIEYVGEKEKTIKYKFSSIDEIKEFNQYKVIKAMQDNKLSSTDFYWTTGYGYGDVGREKVESIYANILALLI